jgi:hypothetical protein
MRPEKSAGFDAMLSLAYFVGPDVRPFRHVTFPRKA